MAMKPSRGAIPVDNRSKMITFGTPEPVSIPDIEAMEASALVCDSEANPPQMPESEGPVANPTSGDSPAAAPAPVAQPAQNQQQQTAPATPEGQPPAAVEEDPFMSKWSKMTDDERREMARNQSSMIGRQSEEIGYSRKVLDMIAAGKFPVTPQTPEVRPNPTEKFFTPKLDDSAKQELVALQLTDPEKYEEVMFTRFQLRQQAINEQHSQQARQHELLNEFQKVQDVVTSPDFAVWERNLPPHVIETAKHDPNTLRWVVNQFQSSRAPVQQSNAPDRVVKIGNAAGAPASAVHDKSATHGLTRTKVLKMMAERPDEYAARQQEISQLIMSGQIPGYE